MQDPPEYYHPPGGLLTFDLQLGDLVNKSVPVNGGVAAGDYIGHFDLVNAQLQQVGAPLAHNARIVRIPNRESWRSWKHQCILVMKEWLALAHDKETVMLPRTPCVKCCIACTGWIALDGYCSGQQLKCGV